MMVIMMVKIMVLYWFSDVILFSFFETGITGYNDGNNGQWWLYSGAC